MERRAGPDAPVRRADALSEIRSVEVYVNLHKTWKQGQTVYSVRDAKTKRVIEHRSVVVLTECAFKVQPGGRERVRREQKKNVHAWVKGWMNVDDPLSCDEEVDGPGVEITYDPYKYESFVRVKDLAPIHSAIAVVLSNNSVLAYGGVYG